MRCNVTDETQEYRMKICCQKISLGFSDRSSSRQEYKKSHNIHERWAAPCAGSVDCKFCGDYNSTSRKAVAFIVTSVETFLAEIPDTNYNMFLPQTDKKEGEKKSPPNHLL